MDEREISKEEREEVMNSMIIPEIQTFLIQCMVSILQDSPFTLKSLCYDFLSQH